MPTLPDMVFIAGMCFLASLAVEPLALLPALMALVFPSDVSQAAFVGMGVVVLLSGIFRVVKVYRS